MPTIKEDGTKCCVTFPLVHIGEDIVHDDEGVVTRRRSSVLFDLVFQVSFDFGKELWVIVIKDIALRDKVRVERMVTFRFGYDQSTWNILHVIHEVFDEEGLARTAFPVYHDCAVSRDRGDIKVFKCNLFQFTGGRRHCLQLVINNFHWCV